MDSKVLLSALLLVIFIQFSSQQALDSCSLRPDPGMCKAFMPRFFYNPEKGDCEEFIYGGCGGNENRYEKIEDCRAACK
ncbi:PI-actitoxin-Aeq3b-like [Physella acuta]|uniref:PI-actitoxin-Aeq3b-like n=1 Tax=Physella acuta TaxID=109671 RepID=UPI0027DCC697|nr:PI-actitoxin-Aeq3b-like [Physella acuta]